MDGFFSGVEFAAVKRPLSLLPECGPCGMSKTCQSPKMKPTGKGRKEILICSEFPGKREDEQGIQLVGNAGRELDRMLRKCGIDMREDCVLTNALVCAPEDPQKVKPRAVEFCRPNLLNTVREMQPKVVILLGGKAVDSLIGHVWREEVGKIGRWVGWQIPLQKWNCWVCPTYNPAYLLREEDQVLTREAEKHLKEACEITTRPWETIPDYRKQVELIYDPVVAAHDIRLFTKRGEMTAFDFETNCLKPDGADAEIVCCSLSDGRRTIAFPWDNRGPCWAAFRDFVKSDVPKVASNLDMEERWTRKFVGCSVNGWLTGHDTMLGAHALDSRGGITGLKFQAFVHLGMEDYAAAVAPYLKSSGGGNSKNRIREVPMDTLLMYGGLDSLLEVKVAKKQRKELGIT
jgi:uracil-DNA glycosylase family 4